MKTIYILMGTPGVGKTTFIEKMSNEIFGDDTLLNYVLSPDNIRRMVQTPDLNPDGTMWTSMRNEKMVWEHLNQILDNKTIHGDLIIVDATHSRNSAISNYRKYTDIGYRVTLIDFRGYATLDEIKARNTHRPEIKFVPEDRIETMFQRLEVIDIPGWVEVIKPSEFKKHFTNIKFDFEHMDSLTFIGDVHNMSEELTQILDKNGLTLSGEYSPTEGVVFVGDYFDRGPNPIETFKILQELQKYYWVLFLAGNHENQFQQYVPFLKELHNAVLEYISKDLLVNIQKHNLTSDEINILKRTIGSSYKKFDAFIEAIKNYPTLWELISNFVNTGCKLPKDIKVYTLGKFKQNMYVNISQMKLFALSDIKYTEIVQFHKRLAQIFYGTFNGIDIVATHGGLPDIPTKLTPTSNMIRGVGRYPDIYQCFETFHQKNPQAINICGHRNPEMQPPEMSNGFNLTGDPDTGMCSVKFTKGTLPDVISIPPTENTTNYIHTKYQSEAKYRSEIDLTKIVETEGLNLGLLGLFKKNRGIIVKELPNNISAVNFKASTFRKGNWNAETIKARGLFLDNNHPEDNIIIARGYEKFFNLNERSGFQIEDIRKLRYPITAYEKANGYIGLLSVDTRGDVPTWFISSKSTTRGDFADNFRRAITPGLTQELMDTMIDDQVTLTFEVIDPVFDPHIQEYNDQEIVLLDAIKNEINFSKKEYQYLYDYIELFDRDAVKLRVKSIIGVCENYTKFRKLVQTLDTDVLIQNGIEGCVFEDSDGESNGGFIIPNIFKLKTKWYSFWKHNRTTAGYIKRKMMQEFDRTGSIDLTISDSVHLKQHLHTAEDIRVYNFMVDYIQEKLVQDKDYSPEIISIRNEFFK